MQLNLQKPIVFFDLETTGVNVGHDHIVEICLHKVNVDNTTETKVYRVLPVDQQGNTVHIPEFTTAIHGISDADVADKPSFADLAKEIAEFIGNADLAGYNSNKFDVPLLVEEFLRAGYPFDLKCRNLVDVQNIFHKMEQRTLKAAYRFYCGKELENAHSADADTLATYEVLMAQLDRYQGVEYTDRDGEVSTPIVNDMDCLSQFTRVNPWADLAGHVAYDAHLHEVFNFGKHKGETLEAVFAKEPSYYDWMMKADFPLSTKAVLTEVWNRMRDQKLQDLKLHFGG
ncbi:MAG: ribonuclease H-like domain-containing protein [Bacteroidales bacterium]|nr:ribonuclease H-like domain-containing protein [Candidatus Colimorpha merdihippi]